MKKLLGASAGLCALVSLGSVGLYFNNYEESEGIEEQVIYGEEPGERFSQRSQELATLGRLYATGAFITGVAAAGLGLITYRTKEN